MYWKADWEDIKAQLTPLTARANSLAAGGVVEGRRDATQAHDAKDALAKFIEDRKALVIQISKVRSNHRS